MKLTELKREVHEIKDTDEGYEEDDEVIFVFFSLNILSICKYFV